MKQERLRRAQCVKEKITEQQNNKTRREGDKVNSQAEKLCSAVGGALWFLWPGFTAHQDPYPPHSLTKEPQLLPSEGPQTLHTEYIQNQSHLSHSW